MVARGGKDVRAPLERPLWNDLSGTALLQRPFYSQPFSLAIRTASARFRTASFWMAVER